ncbi:MAG: hypothetical protein EAZ37_03230 [Burkholderiales bacterium]|nr:MAG: hypothetical protein EAZ37_03230 [Burkholderiales bacterium]
MLIDPVQAKHVQRFANLVAMAHVGVSAYRPLADAKSIHRQLSNSTLFWQFASQGVKLEALRPMPSLKVLDVSAPQIQADHVTTNSVESSAIAQTQTTKADTDLDIDVDTPHISKNTEIGHAMEKQAHEQARHQDVKTNKAVMSLTTIKAADFFRVLPWISKSIDEALDIPQRIMHVLPARHDEKAVGFFSQLPWLTSKATKLSIGAGQNHLAKAYELSDRLGRVSPAADWRSVSTQTVFSFFEKIPWTNAKARNQPAAAA